jgi:hypothetical protein
MAAITISFKTAGAGKSALRQPVYGSGARERMKERAARPIEEIGRTAVDTRDVGERRTDEHVVARDRRRVGDRQQGDDVFMKKRPLTKIGTRSELSTAIAGLDSECRGYVNTQGPTPVRIAIALLFL